MQSLKKSVEQASTLPKKMEVSKGYFYYKSTGIGSGAIKIISHDNAYLIESLGVKTLKVLKNVRLMF